MSLIWSFASVRVSRTSVSSAPHRPTAAASSSTSTCNSREPITLDRSSRAGESAPIALKTTMDQQEFKADVVIVGAGMAGLAAADYLRRSGITDFVILEASQR